ncbi:xanthine dehydrogenase family protein molybdopterin-binding subunit [Acuticoccus sediminis]|uniref:Xanthine dehydrogenase family protein molybdopterin-binding subunit n=1 Tax=Acuticoccus sediminis TaxID=2184697 RepID=A0A8B2NCS2_9HYPH|nr:molybdopterin cofactor-binding domain-containing protein [Acuticoccus sediminis]RAH96110.1 xanthine dehydrogenase family protein molybdopterin-binding subunit [Acuticoccus sediminis]
MTKLLSRRTFLLTGAALGGTALVAALGGLGYLATVDVDGLGGFVDGDDAVMNAFVTLHDDGRVVVKVPRTEMGQGIHTGLAMLVAEEMDIPFDERISVEHPVELLPVYAHWAQMLGVRPEEPQGPVTWIGRRLISSIPLITTGASASTLNLWHPMRVAGAAARHMLLAAGAARLGVPVAELTTSDAAVHHAASGRSIPYADLARQAAVLAPPDRPALKPRSEWRIIGRSQRRVDIPAKVKGEPVFGIDVVLPDMLHASIRHAPVFGTRVVRIANEAEVRAEPDVLDVAIIEDRSVAVVARSWWQAETAAARLDVEWSASEADAVSSDALDARLADALEGGEPYIHVEDGDVGAALAVDGARVVQATYVAPLVAHACMESMNATVVLRPGGRAEAWVPSQSISLTRWAVFRGMGWAGVDPAEVVSHITMNGGAFGRRTETEVVAEAAFLAARHPGRPVKLLWPREEDIGRAMYRSHARAGLTAVLGADGLPAAWDALVAAQSLMQSIGSRTLPITPSPDGDRLTAEGLEKPYYALPARRVRSVHVPSHVPIGLWRSNGFSFNTFFAESFVDECAAAAETDPVDYRRALLARSPRHLAVIERVAALSGWGAPMAAGRSRGIAMEHCFESIVAVVAEVIVTGDGEVRVPRVFCAVDVGTVVNPDAVVAQMEGGILFGLTTALISRVTLSDGRIEQSNFHDFTMPRLANAPEVVVEIVPSELPPGGAGEPGVAPIAAAVGNAIFAATGTRPRSLPLALAETTGAGRLRTVLAAEAG